MHYVFFLCVFDPACYEETKQEWGRTNLTRFPKFCITSVEGTPEHECFQLILPSSMLFFTIWMLTLDPVIVEHCWQSLEKLSFAIIGIKNTNLVIDFVHIFLLIFFIVSKSSFQHFMELRLHPECFSFLLFPLLVATTISIPKLLYIHITVRI